MQHKRYPRVPLWAMCAVLLLSMFSMRLLADAISHSEITTPSIIFPQAKATNLALSLAYFEDPTRAMTLDDIRHLPKRQWSPYSDLDFRVGNSRSAYWMTFSFRGDATLAAQSEFMLEFNVAFLGELDIHILRNPLQNPELTSYFTGILRPFGQRPYPVENPVIPLYLEPNENITVLVRVTNEGPILLPPVLYPKQDFHLARANRNLMLGGFLSLCIVLGCYNLFLYFSIRDNSYLLYTLSIFLLGWFQASLHGLTSHYVWQAQFRGVSYIEPSLTLWAWYAAQLLFTRKFLQLDTHFKKLDRLFIGLTAFCGFMMIGSCFPPLYWAWQVYGIASPTLVFIVLASGIYAYRQGQRSARFFLMGGSFLLLGCFVTAFYYLGILPAHVLAKNGILMGSAIEGILYSLALADRINSIQRDKVHAEKQARLTLEASHKDKDEFLIAVSHELRTPLNAIMGAIELSKKETSIDRLKENNELSALGLHRMQDSVDNLLYLSSLNDNTLKPSASPFTVREMVSDLANATKEACAEKNLQFNLSILLPEHRHYIGDVDILRMLLKQLLKNAVMFTHQGSVTLTLSEHLTDNGPHQLIVTIADTGDGIAPERMATLFDAFRQGSSGYNRTHEGLGIGLNICKRLIHLIGGDMQVHSELSKGTCVTLTVPVARS